jgi:hypothetical protein
MMFSGVQELGTDLKPGLIFFKIRNPLCAKPIYRTIVSLL